MAPVTQGLTALLALGLSTDLASADPTESKVQLCASCHGKDGLPSDRTVPIIWGQQAGYIEKQLNDYKNGNRDSQIMSSIAESLTDDDVPAIAAYFAKKKWPVKAVASQPAAPAAIATCEACHKDDLAGGASSEWVAPRLAGQFLPYLVATMNAYADGERANNEAMSTMMKNLSLADREIIADYLAATQ